jgi:hypothetical protein
MRTARDEREHLMSTATITRNLVSAANSTATDNRDVLVLKFFISAYAGALAGAAASIVFAVIFAVAALHSSSSLAAVFNAFVSTAATTVGYSVVVGALAAVVALSARIVGQSRAQR